MIEIKQYWIDDLPKIEDIEEVFKIVKEQNVVVEIKWYVRYAGEYHRFIFPEDTQSDVNEYFEKRIPHVYPM